MKSYRVTLYFKAESVDAAVKVAEAAQHEATQRGFTTVAQIDCPDDATVVALCAQVGAGGGGSQVPVNGGSGGGSANASAGRSG